MIEAIIRTILETIPPASGDDLTGFMIDAEHFFGSCAPFKSVAVDRSSNPSSIVKVNAELHDNVASVQDISRALTSVLPQLAYYHFSAGSVDWFREATVLRFVTIPSGDGYCVTGTVLATGPKYPKLLARFERDFSQTHGPIRSWQDAS